MAAQSFISLDKWKKYVDDLVMDGVDDKSVEILYEELSFLVDHPFDLNSLTEEDLKKLPFLTDRQIKELVAYRKRYGKFITVYELKNVEGLDFNTLELLLPFVYIEKFSVDKRLINVDNLFTYGKNELYFRYDRCFQQKKGYQSVSDSILAQFPNRKYIGEDYYTSFRYSYSFDERIQLGFIAEKDAGEPFWNKTHKGFDYYSVHLLIKDIKALKCLVIGDYKASFGQGLVMNSDYSLSHSVAVTQGERRNNGFRRHYSTNESDFFRGVGGTMSIHHLDLSLFYSDKVLDGTVDSLLVTSLKTDGLHRLHRDWDKRHRVKMRTVGGNVQFLSENSCFGLTALHYSFDGKRYEPELKPYNVYYFRGKENTNMSIDYLFKAGPVKFYGETAISANKHLATLNGLQIQPASYVSFLLLYRNYDKAYQSFFENGFGQNSSVQNEEGVYLGLQMTPVAFWKLSAYADVFRFPWLKYGVDAPSSGKEYKIQLDHSRGSNSSFSFRYRYKQTEKNRKTENGLVIVKYRQHRFRMQYLYDNKIWSFRTLLDGVKKERDGKGGMLGENISFQPEKGKIKGDFFMAYFDTDNSSATVQSFERSPLYIYYKPSFYGQGLRLTCSLQYSFSAQLLCLLKLASTHYFDRNKIGTELEEIVGKDKTDLNFILRCKF
ncbi:MAG: helix-hairpin-helix domain-containing protein [Massilibacteroides sp.]|nr:helix-hairpin-helix domain-containing protein [Massilibacteroides sp.]